ncbi:NAD-dependent epimerase/dehydratase family protein [bacterium]|nr:NAD-dependent epimerase/dehydratase family protein [bacterium]
MNIFITGGAGFIGSHFASKMLERPDIGSVVVYDNFSSGSLQHLAGIKEDSRLKIIEGDIKHLGMLTNAMAGANMVVHLAANPDIAKAVKQPDIDFWEGTYLAQNVLEAMRINKINQILYTSGSGVYGEVPGMAFRESYGPCYPISTYGASKLACEALISSYCHMFSMKGIGFRFANVVGPRQTHGVGYDFIRRLRDEPSHLIILGNGTQLKSYIFVEDVINAMLLAAQNMSIDTSPFTVYNVATDDYITVKEIADIACEIAGLSPSKVEYRYTGGDRGWKGDVPKVLFDVNKIKGIGWRANRNSHEAIKESIKSMYKEISKEVE